MLRSEMTRLLGAAASVDNRIVTDAMVSGWMQVIGALEFAECFQALGEFRRENPGTYLEPGHIYQLVMRAREEAEAEAPPDWRALSLKEWKEWQEMEVLDRG